MFSTIPNLVSKSFGIPPTVCSISECFTSNGTWYCCPGTFCIEVVLVAGGGGGGSGVLQCSLFRVTGGAGGGAGGVQVSSLTSLIGSCANIFIGAGGAGGPDRFSNIQGFGNPGSEGGCSCFAQPFSGFPSLIVTGGQGGLGGYSDNIDVFRAGGAGGGGSQGSSPAGANISVGCLNGQGGSQPNKPGGGGAGFSINYDAPGDVVNATPGGCASGTYGDFCGITLSDGGYGGNDFQCGSSSTGGFGGGGGGGAGYANTNPAGRGFAGGAGAPGIIKVTQYYIG